MNPAIKRNLLVAVALAAAIIAIGGSPLCAGDKAAPSPELRNLEREVSLKIAHASDEGQTDPERRAQLHDAQQLDMKAEKAMAAGSYQEAEDDLVKANAILGRLGQ
jgi:hypothetical protein